VLGTQVTLRRANADSIPILRPGVYLGIETDGRVVIVAHRSEMGQGVLTSLPKVVADELDADWAKVTIEQAPGDPARAQLEGAAEFGASIALHGQITVTNGQLSRLRDLPDERNLRARRTFISWRPMRSRQAWPSQACLLLLLLFAMRSSRRPAREFGSCQSGNRNSSEHKPILKERPGGDMKRRRWVHRTGASLILVFSGGFFARRVALGPTESSRVAQRISPGPVTTHGRYATHSDQFTPSYGLLETSFFIK
jgi:Molybdopterin-binding domain of aldehyde dehydrogenase